MSKEPMVLELRAPHQKYYTKDGEQVSGVTTVLGELAKPALLTWYAQMEREGIIKAMGSCSWTASQLGYMLPVRPKTSKPLWYAEASRDKAADLGTIAHAHIEAWHQGRTLSPEGLDPVLYEKAKAPFERFKSWWNDAGLTLINAELQMVSEKWRVGGTADQIGATSWERELWDTKTGKPWYNGRPYPDQIAQAVAYAEMYEELTQLPIDRIRIARIGKTEGDEGGLYALSDREREAGLERWLAALGAHRSTKKFNALWKGGSK